MVNGGAGEGIDPVERQAPRGTRQKLLEASTAAGIPDAGLAADVLSLLTRGY
ncbi:hypothetical protein ACWGIV_21645 [Streptomyces sp. NPDC054844]